MTQLLINDNIMPFLGFLNFMLQKDDQRSKSKPNKATKVLVNLNAREAGNNLSNINRLENMKRRLQKRRQQEANKRNEARSVEKFPQGMYEKKLSNGYIASYA